MGFEMTQSNLPWVHHLWNHIGLTEIPGKKHNPTLVKWLSEMGRFSEESRSWWEDDETPWCGLAVGHAMGVSGRFVVPNWFRAKAWGDSNYMSKLDKPAYGCIATKTRKGGGHVFIVVGKNNKGQIMGLGGNQGNRISIIPFNPSDIDGYWWPSIWDGNKCVKSLPSQARYNLPVVNGTGSFGASEA